MRRDLQHCPRPARAAEPSRMTGEDATFEVRIVGPGLDPRSLRVHSRATVLEVKRGAFGAEVAAGRRVTLVCQGQRLHDDRTLTSYGIASGVTLHCR